jgi:hydrogenase maturation factor HypF (carbamoyltransferase family)
MKETTRRLAICPRCGKEYTAPPSISRRDNATRICPDCGTREALESIGVSVEEQDKIIQSMHNFTPND